MELLDDESAVWKPVISDFCGRILAVDLCIFSVGVRSHALAVGSISHARHKFTGRDLLHDIGDWIFSPFFPRESPSVTATFRILASLGNAQFGFGIDQSIYTLKLAFALTGFLCVASFVYTICRLLERRGWYIRV